MTSKRTLTALAVAAIAGQGVFATAAMAMPGKGHKAEMSVMDFDANADGSVSVEEFDAGISAKMSEWHTKKADWHANSGKPGPDDHGKRGPGVHGKPGPDDHGKVTPPKGADLDTNGDGNISEEEFESHLQEVRDRWENRDANASEDRAENADDDTATN